MYSCFLKSAASSPVSAIISLVSTVPCNNLILEITSTFLIILPSSSNTLTLSSKSAVVKAFAGIVLPSTVFIVNLSPVIGSPDSISCDTTYTCFKRDFAFCWSFVNFVNCSIKNAIIKPVINKVINIPNKNEFCAFLCIGFLAMLCSSSHFLKISLLYSLYNILQPKTTFLAWCNINLIRL